MGMEMKKKLTWKEVVIAFVGIEMGCYMMSYIPFIDNDILRTTAYVLSCVVMGLFCVYICCKPKNREHWLF
jgi:uncharacterized membrane protein